MTEDSTIKATIINAAMMEFELRSFNNVKMEDIADRAGVSRRAMLRHFLDKKAIFMAVLEELNLATKNIPLPRFAPGFPIRDQMEELMRALFAFFGDARNCRLCRIVVAEITRQAELGEGQFAQTNVARQRVASWLADAMAQGALRAGSPDKAAQRLMALVQSLTLWPMLLHNAVPLATESSAREAVDFFLGYYGIQGR